MKYSDYNLNLKKGFHAYTIYFFILRHCMKRDMFNKKKNTVHKIKNIFRENIFNEFSHFITKKISLKSIYIASVLFLSLTLFHAYSNSESRRVQQDLKDSVIRFHVRANSDNDIDQSIKLSVKDAVVDYIYKNTKSCSSTNDTELFLLNHNDDIKSVAKNTLERLGYNYSISSSYGLQDFPNKNYGDVIFPAGTYTSYTIYIGEGKGHNWWCVLYPPLCFTDASGGVLPDDSKEILKENVSATDYEYLEDNEPIFRFKYLSFLNTLIN